MKSVAVAESLTGGGVGEAITQQAGASAYFRGGVIAYSNEIKREVLGVSEEILASHGAVSGECALAMARSVRRLFHTDLGLATTGVAGPDPLEGKSVGTVFIALAGEDLHEVRALTLTGDRDQIRAQTVAAALDLMASPRAH